MNYPLAYTLSNVANLTAPIIKSTIKKHKLCHALIHAIAVNATYLTGVYLTPVKEPCIPLQCSKHVSVHKIQGDQPSGVEMPLYSDSGADSASAASLHPTGR